MLLRHYLVRGEAMGVIVFMLATGCGREQKELSSQMEQTTKADALISRAAEEPGKGREMIVEQIVERVRQTDRSVLQSPEQIPIEAGEPLLKLLSEDDVDVRELALLCLHYAGGTPARKGIIKSLHDKAETVRSVACRYLSDHADSADLPSLLVQVTSNTDAYVREHVALAIGRLGDAQAAQSLNNQLKQETDPDVQRAIRLALARLGDEPMRQAYLTQLSDDEPAKRVRALEDFLYVRDGKSLRYILPLLDDLRDAKNVAPGGYQYYIRVCDVVVQILDSYLGHPFDFEVQFTKRYNVKELDEAKGVLAKKVR